MVFQERTDFAQVAENRIGFRVGFLYVAHIRFSGEHEQSVSAVVDADCYVGVEAIADKGDFAAVFPACAEHRHVDGFGIRFSERFYFADPRRQ